MTSLVTLLFVAVASATLVSAGTQFYTTLQVGQDVTLERGSTNFNYLKYLIVGKHPNYPLKRSLLQFQQLDVTNCDTVVSAYLQLYFVYAHKASFMSTTQVPFISRTVVAHRVYKTWAESQATSTKRFTNVYWSSPWLGLGSDAAYHPTSSAGVTIGPSSPAGWYQIDVTSAVRHWKSGQPNHGLLIRATNEYTEGRDFRFSSNNDLDNPGRRARILVLCESNSGGSTGGGGGGAGGGIGVPVGEIPAI